MSIKYPTASDIVDLLLKGVRKGEFDSADLSYEWYKLQKVNAYLKEQKEDVTRRIGRKILKKLKDDGIIEQIPSGKSAPKKYNVVVTRDDLEKYYLSLLESEKKESG